MSKIYDDLVEKYGHIMLAEDLAKELRMSIGTLRNRNSKGTLPVKTSTQSQRIMCSTAEVAAYLESLHG